MKTCCMVVIGHVDHGKTSLVRALTGIETDRLPEEKTRGLSILPGFAHQSYPAGLIDFVDTPGHEDFIPAMISGATGASAALVVISAVEGIGAQTLEHLRIAEILGIKEAVIAVTKSDMLDPTNHAERLRDIATALSETSFRAAPLILCSAHGGHGINKVEAALVDVLQKVTPPPAPDHCFLPIDRAFSLAGLGTIVTGTLLGQTMSANTELTLHPTGRKIAIRGLQTRGGAREHVHVGERVAANLRGITVHDVPRGAVLGRTDAFAPSTCFDVHLQLLPDVSNPLKHMQELRVLFGTSSEVAQLRLFGGGRIDAAQSGFAQLRFKTPVIGFAGQWAILRRLSPSETIGGAVFLDPQALPAGSGNAHRLRILKTVLRGDLGEIAEALCKAQGGVADVSDIALLSRTPAEQVRVELGYSFESISPAQIASKQAVEICKTRFLDKLRDYHDHHPLRMTAPRPAFNVRTIAPVLLRHVAEILMTHGQIRHRDNRFALINHDPFLKMDKDQHDRICTLEESFRQAGLAPNLMPEGSQNQNDADLIALLIDTGRLVALENIALKQTVLLHADALANAAAVLAAAFPAQVDFTTSQARTSLNTSRRIIVPVLEYFDAQRITLRNANTRRMTGANVVPPPAPDC